MERIAANRFNPHAGLFNLPPPRKSAYRQFHSTETVVATVRNNTVRPTDSGLVSALTLFDLSVAFDTMDRCTLLDV